MGNKKRWRFIKLAIFFGTWVSFIPITRVQAEAEPLEANIVESIYTEEEGAFSKVLEEEISDESGEESRKELLEDETLSNIYREADDDFVIREGVLEKYTGNDVIVEIPNGVTTIGKCAFVSVDNLNKIIFPASVISIEERAFEGCSNLKESKFLSDEIGATECGESIEFFIPANITYIGKSAFEQCAFEKLEIIGNNTVIEEGAFAKGCLKKVTFEGTYKSISSAFTEQENLQTIIVNGTINSILKNCFLACESLKEFIVNGEIGKLDDDAFRWSPDITIYGKDQSYIRAYADRWQISFNVIERSEFQSQISQANDTMADDIDVLQEKPEEDIVSDNSLWSVEKVVEQEKQDDQNVIELVEGSTCISQKQMEDIVKNNESKDVVIVTNGGVVFTFPKGSMKLIPDKEVYDFGVELITDYKQAGVDISKENFVFKISYNNSGELPGTAQVSVPVGSKWAGQKVYYSVINADGTLAYAIDATVDDNGVYVIPELHFTL